MSEFAYVLRPAFDELFLERATPSERAVFARRGAYLEELFEAGVLLFARRCSPGPFALIVIEAEDEPGARRVMEADPTVRSGLQTAELHPFRVFLARGRGAG